MNNLKEAVQEFFRLLDITDESESGRKFNPITVGCCRVMLMKPLDECLIKMKEYSND